MKTKEELDALKEEVETLSRKLAQLNEEELKQVSGGFIPPYPPSSKFPNEPLFHCNSDGSVKAVELNIDWGAGPQEYDCSGLIS